MKEEDPESFIELDINIERLRDYGFNPVELNRAGYLELMELPGIDRKIAGEIMKRRGRLDGFKTICEIKDLLGDSMFEMVSPFIIAGDKKSPLYFSGRFSILASIKYPYHDYYFELDEFFQRPVQIESIFRVNFGDRIEAGLRTSRKASAHHPPVYAGAGELNFNNVINHFPGTRHLMVRDLGIINTLILGSYRVDYLRPASRTRILRNIRPDDRSSSSGGFYGAAARFYYESWEGSLFVSDKHFPVREINEHDGSVAVTQRALYYSGNYPLFKDPVLNERACGAVLHIFPAGNVRLSAGGYDKRFSRVIDHKSDFTNFRGDRISIIDLEAEFRLRNLRIIADWGLCIYDTFEFYGDDERERDWFQDSGNALRVTLLSGYRKAQFWGYYWTVDHDYFDLPGEGYDATYNARNERRLGVGARLNMSSSVRAQAEAIYREKIMPEPSGSMKDSLELRLRKSWDVAEELFLRYSGIIREREGFRSEQVGYTRAGSVLHRLELVSNPDERLRLRTVFRSRKEIYHETAEIAGSDAISGNYFEIRYRPVKAVHLTTRFFSGAERTGIMIRPVFNFSQGTRFFMEYASGGAYGSSYTVSCSINW